MVSPPTGPGTLRARLNGNSRRLEQRDPTGPPHHSDGNIPSRMATITASRRLDAPSFFRRLSMWFLAVYQLTPNSSAMYLVSQTSAK